MGSFRAIYGGRKEKTINSEERRIFRRYLRTMKRYRDRKKRRAAALFLAAALLWTGCAFLSRGELIRYEEESRLEYHLPGESGSGIKWRAEIDFRTGKLSFIREERNVRD